MRAQILAGLFAVTGALHFVVPEPYDRIIPQVLPGDPRLYTWASGAAEVAVAALVARQSTRRLGGSLAAALLVAVFPANVQMAIDWSDRGLLERVVAYGRLPLQIPLIALAVSVAASAAHGPRAPRRAHIGRLANKV